MKISRKNLNFITFPISLIYSILVSFRNIFYNIGLFPTKEYQIPIISIGNITVGGTGKTPHTEYLIKLLKEKFVITVLSRGYKRKTRGFVRATYSSTASEIGDEPIQIKRKFSDTELVVCANRVNAIDRILKEDTEKKQEILILDDAYQHRAIKAGISILLMDHNRPIYEDHILPYGDLREKCSEKYRANIVIVTKTPVNIKPIEKRIIEKNLNLFPYQSLYYSTINYGSIINIFDNDVIISDLENYEIILLTGIANTKQLTNYIEKKSKILKHFNYSDHHIFSSKEIELLINEYNKYQNDNTIIITTEKDSMRLLDNKKILELRNYPIFYIPIEVEFFPEDKESFENQIINYVRKNKRSDKLYKNAD